jgi:Na+(H+)/acetate symporter ActP
MASVGGKADLDNLGKIYAVYTGGFIVFVIGLAIAEQMGLSHLHDRQPFLRPRHLVIKTISSGLFGIPLGFITIFVVSRMTAPPSQEMQDFVESVRIPKGASTASSHN